MLLSVIIVSYNTKDLTLQTLHSVMAEVHTSPVLKNKTEIIVVDNNSQDNSVAAISKLSKDFAHLHIITNPTNAGFAAANNLGIEQAKGEYLLLLNSDTIVQPGALTTLVETFEALPVKERTSVLKSHHGEVDRLGILAATLLNEDGSLQHQGGSLPSLGTIASHMLMLDDLPLIGKLFPSTQHTGLRAQDPTYPLTTNTYNLIPTPWVGGTAMMIRRAVIDEIGALDHNIFMYGEDIEFCLRAQKHHWDVAIHQGAEIIHLGSKSGSQANALKGEFRGYVYIWSKHKAAWQLPVLKIILKIGALARWLVFGTMKRDPVKTQVYAELFYAELL